MTVSPLSPGGMLKKIASSPSPSGRSRRASCRRAAARPRPCRTRRRRRLVARVERVALSEVALVRPLLDLLQRLEVARRCRTSRRRSGRSSRGCPAPARRRPGPCPRGGSRRTGPGCRARSPARRPGATRAAWRARRRSRRTSRAPRGRRRPRPASPCSRTRRSDWPRLGDAPERALAELLPVVGPLELLQRLRRVGLVPPVRLRVLVEREDQPGLHELAVELVALVAAEHVRRVVAGGDELGLLGPARRSRGTRS